MFLIKSVNRFTVYSFKIYTYISDKILEAK